MAGTLHPKRRKLRVHGRISINIYIYMNTQTDRHRHRERHLPFLSSIGIFTFKHTSPNSFHQWLALHQKKDENYAFMNCTLEVDATTKKGRKVVSAVLNSIHETSNCKMLGSGKIEVSGRVYPQVFLKMLSSMNGKKAQIKVWQFGKCHSNLYNTEPKPEKKEEQFGGRNDTGYYVNDGSYYGWGQYYVDDRHSHWNGEYGDWPWPKCPYQALEAPSDAAQGKGTVPGDRGDPKGTAPLPEKPLQSGGGAKQCCCVM